MGEWLELLPGERNVQKASPRLEASSEAAILSVLTPVEIVFSRILLRRRCFSATGLGNPSQRYYCLDLHDYAIFFSISKPQNTTNRLKLRIISVYEVAEWGRPKLPKGKLHNVRYILEMRNAGKSV